MLGLSDCPKDSPQKMKGRRGAGNLVGPSGGGDAKETIGERELPVVCLELAAAVGRLKPAAAEGISKRMGRQTSPLSRRTIRRHELTRLKLFFGNDLRLLSLKTCNATACRHDTVAL